MAETSVLSTNLASVKQAAAAIIALINERSQSPRPEDIEAVLIQLVGNTAERASPLAQDIRALIPQLQAAILAKGDADAKAINARVDVDAFPEYVAASECADRLQTRFDALVTEAWAAPVRSLDDAALLAEIAQHKFVDWVAHGEPCGLRQPQGELPEDDETVGRLIAAVLTLAGRPFTP
jgi:hypothetical protein